MDTLQPADPAGAEERDQPDGTGVLTDRTRLEAVAAWDGEHPALKRRLDEVAARTAARLGFPLSLVSLVLDSSTLFAGSHGLVGWVADVGGVPAEWSFCTTTVVEGAPYVVVDALEDAHQRQNPVVTDGGVRSYAGVPLRAPDGQVVGAHCVLGVDPHEFTPGEIAELERAAAELVDVFEQHRTSGE
ncbi:GAF domain-containing protein [Kineococcus rhizosphaerae]|uniref:GAF domain-containing protein n=1 Tax=Kineococcus rhizosphaerae TaxID=559628 RepID=A0A2T0R0B5_9ACTN|nr:GAF domain-containing protein [Kineococcus rhizosphaerae]PRY12553.1 GAF domain-containing protein [Kineococcus rhizosphaerae]